MKIREATIFDKSEWSRMRTLLWPDTSDNHLQEIEQFYNGDSIDIEFVYVAEVQEQVVGFIEVNIRSFAEGSRSDKVPYIEAWFVDEQYRGQGIGGALMKAVEQWAASFGFKDLASDTEITNTNSISVHKHLGFQEVDRVVCFIKRL